MTFSDRSSAPWRQAALAVATLALVLKILVPPGFMVAEPHNDLPFALVLCTDQGVVTVEPGKALAGRDHEDGAPGKAATHDAPCVFVGHAVGGLAPDLFSPTAVEFFAAVMAPPQRPRLDLAPGRGLAAPPLPARGPPTRLI